MNLKKVIELNSLLKGSLLILIILLIGSVITLVKLSKYFGQSFLILSLIILSLTIILLYLCSFKKTKLAIIIEFFLAIIVFFSFTATNKITNFTKEVSDASEYETVQIVTLKDSSVTKDEDFSNYIMAYSNTDNNGYRHSSQLLSENSKEVKESKPCQNTEKMYNELKNGTVDMIFLNNDSRSDLSTLDENYEDNIKVLLEKKYAMTSAELKPVDIESEPFTLYLQGADLSSGDNIHSTGRGDVNILLTVNPKTEQVYMQVIPRDTFVNIPCRGGRSKLSYSGWWGGVQSSIESIEEKFGIEINYYAKINFNGLIDLVDALGGVTVYSHYTYSYQGYHFTEGYNDVDGKKALRFARARKMLPENELSRGMHQMELIKAIFKKFAENPTYNNGMAVLDSISDNFITNLPEEDYYKAFKLILKVMPSLQKMEMNTLKGHYEWHDDEIRDGYYQYYYYPDEEEIEKVKNNIQSVYDGKKID